jgi:16S rRNA (cytidine1402-2'-O)-methyltransferase
VAGALYLVATPIGNPGDVTARAVEALRSASVVAVEDTRSARTLFRRLGVSPARVVSYHEHNERARAAWLIERLRAGEDVALVPEAGTPLVSDPGFRLVRAAADEGISVVALPGPSAVLAALSASGLPPDRFSFVGFLPRQRAQRLAALAELAGRPETLVAFEAPHRILESLEDAQAALGERRAAIGVNLTKPTERFLRGTLAELRAELGSWEQVRGEMTVVIEGATAAPPELDSSVDDAIRALLAEGLGPRAIRDALAPVVDAPKATIYNRAVELAR